MAEFFSFWLLLQRRKNLFFKEEVLMTTLSESQENLVKKLRIDVDKHIREVGMAVVGFYQSRQEKRRQEIVQALKGIVSEMYFYEYLKKEGFKDREAVVRSVRVIDKEAQSKLHRLCKVSVKALNGDFDQFWEKLSLVLSN